MRRGRRCGTAPRCRRRRRCRCRRRRLRSRTRGRSTRRPRGGRAAGTPRSARWLVSRCCQRKLLDVAPQRRLPLENELLAVRTAERDREQPPQVGADDLDRAAADLLRLGRRDGAEVPVLEAHGAATLVRSARWVCWSQPSGSRERLASVRVLDVRGEVLATEPRYQAYPERYREAHIPGAVFCDWRHDFTDPASDVPVTVALAGARSPPTRPGSASAPTRRWSPTTPTSRCSPAASSGCCEATATAPHTCWTAGSTRGARPACRSRRGDVEPAPADPPHPVPRHAGRADRPGGRSRPDRRRRADRRRAVRPRSTPAPRPTPGGPVTSPARSACPTPSCWTPTAASCAPASSPSRLRTARRGPRPAGRRLLQRRRLGDRGGAPRRGSPGAPRVEVYDGSWNEWGNREDTPIER